MPKENSEDEINLFDAQNVVADRMKSFVSNFNKMSKDRITVGYLSSRITGLDKLWEEFVDNHKIICTSVDDKTKGTEKYFTSNIYDYYEDLYFDASGRMSDKLSKLKPTNPPTLINQPNPTPQFEQRQTPLNSHISIPPLNVPTFNGKYEDWTSFYDLFVAAVDSNRSLQPVHKLQYLKSLLKGDAEILLKHTSITNENYAVALNLLKDRFDNKRAIITCSLKKLFNQRNADETATSIRLLLDNTRECIETLKLQGIDTTTWDCILVFILTQRIPTKSLELWEQTLNRNALPTFEALPIYCRKRRFSNPPIINHGRKQSKQCSIRAS